MSPDLHRAFRPLDEYIEDLEADRRVLRWLESATDEQILECLRYRREHWPDDATLADAVLAMIERDAKPPC